MVQQHWGPGGQVGQFFILGHQFRWVSCHKMLWSTAGVNLRYVDLVTMLWYCKSQYVIGYRRNVCAIVRPFVWCKCTLCLSFMRLGDFDLQPPDFKMTQRRFTSTVGNLYTKLELYGMRQFVFTRTWLSQIRPSVYLSVCRLSVCLSVTLVHPIQGVEPFGDISSPLYVYPLCTLAILRPPCKILRRSSQGNPPSEVLNAKGVA